MFRSSISRALAALAALGLRLFFRTIEFHDFEKVPRGRPLLVVANHFNGFVDAVLLVRGLATVPRFLARSGLWKTKAMHPFLALAGLIPAYRPEDGSDPTKNLEVFSKTYRVLAKGGIVAVFPEGRTHDEPGMIRLRTGAARMALGAREAGAEGLVIVPVGLVFDNKVALRDRASARVGNCIDLDAEIGTYARTGEPEGAENRDAVRLLTDDIETRLREVTAEFATLREQALLRRAAEVAIRTRDGVVGEDVSIDARETLAEEIASAPEEKRAAVGVALGAYALDLDMLDVRDFQLLPEYRESQHLRRAVLQTAKVAVLAPFALVGMLLNIVPFYLVRHYGISTRAAMRGTRRLYVIVVFPVFWLLLAAAAGVIRGAPAAAAALVAVLVLAPALGVLALYEIDEFRAVNDAWRAWGTYRERWLPLEPALEHRKRVVRLVEEAAGSGAPTIQRGEEA